MIQESGKSSQFHDSFSPVCAVCLDGTLPGYHLHRGYGSGANSWLIQLEVCSHTKSFWRSIHLTHGNMTPVVVVIILLIISSLSITNSRISYSCFQLSSHVLFKHAFEIKLVLQFKDFAFMHYVARHENPVCLKNYIFL